MHFLRRNLYICCLILQGVSAVADDTIRVMSYNLLNYPEPGNPAADTTIRNAYFRTIITATAPDILVAQEVTSQAGVNYFLSKVLNTALSGYAAGSFIDGFDSDNAIFYRQSKFSFLTNKRIRTGLRDINEFTLIHLASGDTIRFYSVHLKASNSSADEDQRAREVDSLRKVTDMLPSGSDFIVCGDFNFYRSSETGYQKLKLIQPGNEGHVIDPISITGTWNNPAYAVYHTQSPRIRQFGGGTAGGMDDRFDLILYSQAIADAGGMEYVSSSLHAFGNDGNHYNDSINSIPNNAVPQFIADALHNASDHLPLLASFTFNNESLVTDLGIDVDIPGDSSCHDALDTLTINVFNNGTSVIDFSMTAANIVVDVQSDSGSHSFPSGINSGMLAPGDTAFILIAASVPFANQNIYTASLYFAGDNNPFNDSVSRTVHLHEVPATQTIPSGSAVICNGSQVPLTAPDGISWMWSTGDADQVIFVTDAGMYTVTVTDANGCYRVLPPVIISQHRSLSDTILFYETMGSPTSTITVVAYENANGFDHDELSMSGSADVRTTSPSVYAGASGGGNVFITNIPGRNFIISGINTTGLSGTRLSFGIHKSTTGSTASDFNISYSTDGIIWQALSFTPLPNGSGTATWHQRTCAEELPQSQNLYISFTNTGSACQYRLDDIAVTFTPVVPQISSFTPASVSPGDTITIVGSNLSLAQELLFNDNAGSILSITDSLITGKVPDPVSAGLIGILYNTCDTAFSQAPFATGSGITIQVKLYFEGFYAGGMMSMTDTVTISLHDANAPHALYESCTSTVGYDGLGSFYFPAAIPGNAYYISIRHRNSIETWSKAPVLLNQPVVQFNMSQ